MNKISVIIPVYNNEEYIEKCIRSVMNQTYTNLEIIVVNDGSTDKSLEICQLLMEEDNRIKLISQRNQGVATARNQALDIATGEYIGFVDSDDWIKSEMYEKLVSKAIEDKADIVECGYALVDLDGSIISKSVLIESTIFETEKILYDYFKKNNTTNYNCNKIYNKKLFTTTRYPNYNYSEDYYINVATIINSNIKSTIPYIGYYYLQHRKSATKQDFSEKKLDALYSGYEVYKMTEYSYPNLSVYAIEYLMVYIKSFYLSIVDNKSYKKIKEKLLTDFKQLFSDWYLKILFSDISILNKVTLLIFRINPCLYTSLKENNATN